MNERYCEIKYEPVFGEGGINVDKYNIYYIGGELDGMVEFHSYDGVSGEVKNNYPLKNK
jgi:hypothetical protein